MLGLQLLGFGMVFLLLLSVALFPTWPYSRQWGYVPSLTSGALLLGMIGLLRLGTLL